ncbi:MAG: cytochrome c [Betaproteobacteria bacterium]|nr:cytochrome c [Betaproteobacteria bacterium]
MQRFAFSITVLIWAAVYAGLKLLVSPPVPTSVVTMYMVLTVIGTLIFVAANEARFAHFVAPIRSVFTGEAPRAVQVVVLVAIPAAVAWVTYQRVVPSADAPFEARVVHPEPPASFPLHGKRMEVAGLANPLRSTGPELRKRIAEGKTVYFRNCFFCHGDTLAGDGHFAGAFLPIPGNFRDVGTISMLQESYVFWRVATGGRGLPKGATPWNSAMPVWQNFLTEDEMWKVILYIYDASGSTPRTWDEAVSHAKH